MTNLPATSVGSTTAGRLTKAPAAKAAGNKLITTTAGKAAGMGSVLAALWMMHQSYVGYKDEWAQHYQKFEDDTNLDVWRYRQGSYAGQPAMDNGAQKLNEILAYGVGGTRLLYHKIKTYTEGFVNDVLLNNLIPLGIAAGGVYMGLGEKGRSAILGRLKNAKFSMFREFGKLIGQGLGGVGKGIGRMLDGYSRFTSKNPLASLAIIGLGLFGANRFVRVYNGEEEQAFFRHSVGPPDDNH